MPDQLYDFQLPDGSIATFQSDHQPTEREVADLLGKQQPEQAPKPEVSSAETFGESALLGLAPGAAFAKVAGTVIPAVSAVATPWVGVPAGLIAGGLAAYGVGKAEQKGLQAVAPKFLERVQAGEQEHPIAAFGGELASGLGSFRLATKPAEWTLKQAALRAGAGAAVGAVNPLIFEQRAPTPRDIGAGALFSLAYGGPRKWLLPRAARAAGKGTDASQDEKAAALHGDVRTQPQPGAGEVPTEGGGEGVQPQAEGVAQKAQVSLTNIGRLESKIASAEKELEVTEKPGEKQIILARIDGLKKQLAKLKEAEAPLPMLSPEDQAHIDAEREAIDKPITVLPTDPAREGDPFSPGGRFMSVNRKKQEIEVYADAFKDWLATEAPQDPEGKRLAVKRRLWEERFHLATHDTIAAAYWNSLSAFEKALEKRIYSGKFGKAAGIKTKYGESPVLWGHEAIRRRMQMATGMGASEFSDSMLRERVTVKTLHYMETLVRGIRETLGTKASGEGLALLDTALNNIGAAKAAVGGAKPGAQMKRAEEPTPLEEAEGVLRSWKANLERANTSPVRNRKEIEDAQTMVRKAAEQVRRYQAEEDRIRSQHKNIQPEPGTPLPEGVDAKRLGQFEDEFDEDWSLTRMDQKGQDQLEKVAIKDEAVASGFPYLLQDDAENVYGVHNFDDFVLDLDLADLHPTSIHRRMVENTEEFYPELYEMGREAQKFHGASPSIRQVMIKEQFAIKKLTDLGIDGDEATDIVNEWRSGREGYDKVWDQDPTTGYLLDRLLGEPMPEGGPAAQRKRLSEDDPRIRDRTDYVPEEILHKSFGPLFSRKPGETSAEQFDAVFGSATRNKLREGVEGFLDENPEWKNFKPQEIENMLIHPEEDLYVGTTQADLWDYLYKYRRDLVDLGNEVYDMVKDKELDFAVGKLVELTHESKEESENIITYWDDHRRDVWELDASLGRFIEENVLKKSPERLNRDVMEDASEEPEGGPAAQRKRPPSDDELAAKMGISVEELRARRARQTAAMTGPTAPAAPPAAAVPPRKWTPEEIAEHNRKIEEMLGKLPPEKTEGMTVRKGKKQAYEPGQEQMFGETYGRGAPGSSKLKGMEPVPTGVPEHAIGGAKPEPTGIEVEEFVKEQMDKRTPSYEKFVEGAKEKWGARMQPGQLRELWRDRMWRYLWNASAARLKDMIKALNLETRIVGQGKDKQNFVPSERFERLNVEGPLSKWDWRDPYPGGTGEERKIFGQLELGGFVEDSPAKRRQVKAFKPQETAQRIRLKIMAEIGLAMARQSEKVASSKPVSRATVGLTPKEAEQQAGLRDELVDLHRRARAGEDVKEMIDLLQERLADLGDKVLGEVGWWRPNAWREVSEQEALSLGKLTELIREGARVKGRTTANTNLILALFDKNTGQVDLVSAHIDPNRGPVITDPARVSGMAPKTVNIGERMNRFRPIYRMLLDEPVKDFHQNFKDIKDFNERLGNELNRESRRLAEQQPFYHEAAGGVVDKPEMLKLPPPVTDHEIGQVYEVTKGATTSKDVAAAVADVGARWTKYQEAARALVRAQKQLAEMSQAHKGLKASDLALAGARIKVNTARAALEGVRPNMAASSGLHKIFREILRRDPELTTGQALEELYEEIARRHASGQGKENFTKDLLASYERHYGNVQLPGIPERADPSVVRAAEAARIARGAAAPLTPGEYTSRSLYRQPGSEVTYQSKATRRFVRPTFEAPGGRVYRAPGQPPFVPGAGEARLPLTESGARELEAPSGRAYAPEYGVARTPLGGWPSEHAPYPKTPMLSYADQVELRAQFPESTKFAEEQPPPLITRHILPPSAEARSLEPKFSKTSRGGLRGSPEAYFEKAEPEQQKPELLRERKLEIPRSTDPEFRSKPLSERRPPEPGSIRKRIDATVDKGKKMAEEQAKKLVDALALAPLHKTAKTTAERVESKADLYRFMDGSDNDSARVVRDNSEDIRLASMKPAVANQTWKQGREQRAAAKQIREIVPAMLAARFEVKNKKTGEGTGVFRFNEKRFDEIYRSAERGLTKAEGPQWMQSKNPIRRWIGGKWADSQKKLMEVAKYAKAHYKDPEAQMAMEIFLAHDKAHIEFLNATGQNVAERENWVPGIYEGDIWSDGMFRFGERRLLGTQYRAQKRFRNYWEAGEAGPFIPVTLDVADLAQHSWGYGRRMANRSIWFQSLQAMKDPTTGEAVAVKASVASKNLVPSGDLDANGNPIYVQDVKWSNPKGAFDRELVFPGRKGQGVPLSVLGGYARAAELAMARSAITDGEGVIGAVFKTGLVAEQMLKHGLVLILDLFHPGRLAQMGLAGGKGVSGLRYKEGFSALMYNFHSLEAAVDRGQITKAQADWASEPTLLEHGRGGKPELKGTRHALAADLAKSGLNALRTADTLYRDAIRNIPLIGEAYGKLLSPVNKWIFDQFTPGLMVQHAVSNFERMRARFPELSYDQLKRRVVKDTNAYFGNMGRQGIWKNPTFRDIAQLFLLAPFWQEGIVQKELRFWTRAATRGPQYLVGKAAEMVGDKAWGQKQARKAELEMGPLGRALMRGLGAYFVTTQVINLLSKGHFTWDNKEEGHKLDAWIPTPWEGKDTGIWLNVGSVFAEITHDILRMTETKPTAWEALQQIGANKLSPVGRMLRVLGTGTTPTGQKITTTGGILKEAASELTPPPISLAPGMRTIGSALGISRPNKPGEATQRLLGTFGLKVNVAETREQMMFQKAKHFIEDNNLKKSIGWQQIQTDEPSYTKLRGALRNNDDRGAHDMLKELGKTHKPQEIIKAMNMWKNRPYTGSWENELSFVSHLTDDEKALYRAAMVDRIQLYQKFLQLYIKSKP